MNGVQLTWPDTGATVWWCICAQDDCHAAAFGPHRTREQAEADAAVDDCDNAHFVTDRIGRDMTILPSPFVRLSDMSLMADQITAHETARLEAAR